jgi:hypothetical protein
MQAMSLILRASELIQRNEISTVKHLLEITNMYDNVMYEHINLLATFLTDLLAGNYNEEGQETVREALEKISSESKLSKPTDTKATAAPPNIPNRTINDIITGVQLEMSEMPRDKSYAIYSEAFNTLASTINITKIVSQSKKNKALVTTGYAAKHNVPLESVPELDSFNNNMYLNMKETANLTNRSEMFTRAQTDNPLKPTTSGFIYRTSPMFTPLFQLQNISTLDPNFALVVNRSLMAVSHKTFYLSTNPMRHFGDLYMGIWLLVAWYLIKHERKPFQEIYEMEYAHVLSWLELAIPEYVTFLAKQRLMHQS